MNHDIRPNARMHPAPHALLATGSLTIYTTGTLDEAVRDVLETTPLRKTALQPLPNEAVYFRHADPAFDAIWNIGYIEQGERTPEERTIEEALSMTATQTLFYNECRLNAKKANAVLELVQGIAARRPCYLMITDDEHGGEDHFVYGRNPFTGVELHGTLGKQPHIKP